MATYSRKLKDASGNYVVPATRASCVYMENNSALSLLTFYPTGSIYQSFENTSPASLFGGEWEKLENTFLYGSGTKNVGDTGGEEAHKLTMSELPNYDLRQFGAHRKAGFLAQTYNGIQMSQSDSDAAIPGLTINSRGGDQSHNNMPPYTVINIWKRVA